MYEQQYCSKIENLFALLIVFAASMAGWFECSLKANNANLEEFELVVECLLSEPCCSYFESFECFLLLL